MRCPDSMSEVECLRSEKLSGEFSWPNRENKKKKRPFCPSFLSTSSLSLSLSIYTRLDCCDLFFLKEHGLVAKEAGAPKQSSRRLQRREAKSHYGGEIEGPPIPGKILPADKMKEFE